MKPVKILFVDDEAMALKYFERLVSPMAPVLTASSVEEGRAILREQGAEVAVLVCDQRMPGERGTELLRHARQYYPSIVRMTTTAYSELGEAIEAINSGEIYRYISKPWELETLRAELKNALELAELRSERDALMRDKLLAQQSQLQANRLAALFMVSSAVQVDGGSEAALYQLAQTVLACGGTEPAVSWHRWDHADLLQAEARRGVAVVGHLQQWLSAFQTSQADAWTQLAQALDGEVLGESVRVKNPTVLTTVLDGPAGEPVDAVHGAWLAWLLWQGGQVQVERVDGACLIRRGPAIAPPNDWMAVALEQFGRTEG
ncbi:response regulator [Hydrogenophaga sp.]|uniref:response regulator n=1 Tax=Hydrogenophaga sp. TaxID=1904254 RepID=UPI00356A02C6